MPRAALVRRVGLHGNGDRRRAGLSRGGRDREPRFGGARFGSGTGPDGGRLVARRRECEGDFAALVRKDRIEVRAFGNGDFVFGGRCRRIGRRIGIFR